jgi:DNA-binding MarR family transcriptional regulator
MNMQTGNNYQTPSLPPSLSSVYSSLSPDMKKVFIRVFRFLWNYVAPVKRFVGHSGVLYGFWAIDMLRVKSDLTPSELSMLAYLYQITDQGNKTIHSDIIYNSIILPRILKQSKQGILNDLKHKGYVSRSTCDVSQPYLSRAYSKQPVFIRLTSSGAALIEGIEKDLYRLLFSTSLNEITGPNKKPDLKNQYIN